MAQLAGDQPVRTASSCIHLISQYPFYITYSPAARLGYQGCPCPQMKGTAKKRRLRRLRGIGWSPVVGRTLAMPCHMPCVNKQRSGDVIRDGRWPRSGEPGNGRQPAFCPSAHSLAWSRPLCELPAAAPTCSSTAGSTAFRLGVTANNRNG